MKKQDICRIERIIELGYNNWCFDFTDYIDDDDIRAIKKLLDEYKYLKGLEEISNKLTRLDKKIIPLTKEVIRDYERLKKENKELKELLGGSNE